MTRRLRQQVGYRLSVQLKEAQIGASVDQVSLIRRRMHQTGCTSAVLSEKLLLCLTLVSSFAFRFHWRTKITFPNYTQYPKEAGAFMMRTNLHFCKLLWRKSGPLRQKQENCSENLLIFLEKVKTAPMLTL